MSYLERTPEMICMRLEAYHRVIASDLRYVSRIYYAVRCTLRTDDLFRSLTLSALAALTEPRIDRREVDVKDVCQRPRRNTW